MGKYAFAVAAFILAAGALVGRLPAISATTAVETHQTIAPFDLMLKARDLVDQTVDCAV